jgi:hypothetical protein
VKTFGSQADNDDDTTNVIKWRRELNMTPQTTFLLFSAKALRHNISESHVFHIVLADLNVPQTKQKSALDATLTACSLLNDMSVDRTVSAITLPDRAFGSSVKGLQEVEETVSAQLIALRQFAETRYIITLNIDKRAAVHSSVRRWSQGRLVVSALASTTNTFLGSELATAGRPMADSFLPAQRQLVTPESTSKDEDLRVAEAHRVSPETVLAQKGAGFHANILRSLMWRPQSDCYLQMATSFGRHLAVGVWSQTPFL